MIGRWYATDQLARAVDAFERATTPAEIANAEKRVERWTSVLRNGFLGTVHIGSRRAVAAYPVWVTLEVVRGGFATGRAVAAAPLEPWEITLARTARVDATRTALNLWHVSESGKRHSLECLQTGHFEIDVPEAGAMMAIAFLESQGDVTEADQVKAAISPFFDRLRFYAEPTSDTRPVDGTIVRATVAQASQHLAEMRERPGVAAQTATILGWKPFGDHLAAWLREAGVMQSPMATPSSAVQAEAKEWVRKYAELEALVPASKRVRDPGGSVARLMDMVRCLADGGVDNGAQCRGRYAIAEIEASRGLPGTTPWKAVRERDLFAVRQATRREQAHALKPTLAALPQRRGLSPEIVSVVVATPPREWAWPDGASQPEPLRARAAIARTLAASVEGTAEELVNAGLLRSGEQLADVASDVAAVALSESARPGVELLYGKTYRAFRQRRSLLLVNLQSQVRFSELPWVPPLTVPEGRPEASATDALCGLYVRAFPGTLMPNPLASALNDISGSLGGPRPFLEELAADIFQGDFSPRFARAAAEAADVLEHGLYSTYFDISPEDWKRLRRAVDSLSTSRDKAESREQAALAELAQRRAQSRRVDQWVAKNGAVIEEAQILCAHNLIVATRSFSEEDFVAAAAGASRVIANLLAKARKQRRPYATLKNASYAWRHFVFYVDRIDQAKREAAVIDARGIVATACGPGFEADVDRLFAPLLAAARGEPLSAPSYVYGWAGEHHPLGVFVGRS
ncbi:hypothetical protein [Demequina sp.]|uniref:hypothetical protein n=1 Tax=Demequina sp. TaxID=2050685 RepID=UPI0025BCCA42|nr:hypothetical protein [Demequina sp.]